MHIHCVTLQSVCGSWLNEIIIEAFRTIDENKENRNVYVHFSSNLEPLFSV